MNRQPFRLKSPTWDAKLSPFWVRITRPYRHHTQLNTQRLLEIEVRGIECLRSAVDRGAGVLITPNHPGHADSYAMYEAADQLGRPFFFMTAWQVFEIDKFEEDVLGHRTARIRGARRAIVQFGEPIDVRKFAEGAAQPRKAAGPLTDTLERSVQNLLDNVNQ